MLRAQAQALDTVLIRAEEDRDLRRSWSLEGMVVDYDFNPVPDANVELVGTALKITTNDDGAFSFRALPAGTRVLRVRKLGYAPFLQTIEARNDEQRQLAVLLRHVAANLPAAVISERSGFSGDQVRWAELDQRLRWGHGVRGVVLGPDELRRYEGFGLDVVAKAYGVEGAERRGGAGVTSIVPSGTGGRIWRPFEVAGDVCVLLNGSYMIQRPLASFAAKDIELLEVYPAGTEMSGTIGDRMVGRRCIATSLFKHPTYYVIWEKGVR